MRTHRSWLIGFPLAVFSLAVGALVFGPGRGLLAQQSAFGGGETAATGHGIDVAGMDTTCKPCDDFYHYVNGGWLKKNPVPAAYPSWGRFSELAERNRENLHQILEAASKSQAPTGSIEQKIGDFYASCMDESKVDAEGLKPLQPELDRIDQMQDLASLQAEIGRLHSYRVNALFNFRSTQDAKNSGQVIGGADQGGLGLPDRDYYTKTDDKSKQLRDQYAEHVTKMFRLLGDDDAKAAGEAKTVMGIETKLAEASMTRVERRDPEKTYHKMDIRQLDRLTPNFSWPAFFHDLGYPHITTVDVGQPKFFEEVNRDLAAVPLADWKTYLRWHLIATAAPALSKPFVDEAFNFQQHILQGTEENLPRWKRCAMATDRQLGFALGQLYVKQYFPPEAKARAQAMVHNLVAALHDDIQALPWMGPETKKAALAKLEAFTPKIGYPEKWRDYSAYQVDRGPYLLNVFRGDVFEFNRDLTKIGKPVDRTEWGMTPPTVNAYYSPLRNEIVFPAGILQPPFFDAQADDAVNYGGIGAVIGHEMTHGFDDEGRKFDAQGNLKDWWTAEDAKNFTARADCVEKQFDNYEVLPGLHENGKLVLGESIADLGGLTISYMAFQKSLEGKPQPPKIDGFTPEERFFLSFATIWAANDREQFERLQVNVNPHALARFRAIAAPSNMPPFAQAFDCHAGDPMVRPEDQRCKIW
jgi:putative endopeptidase